MMLSIGICRVPYPIRKTLIILEGASDIILSHDGSKIRIRASICPTINLSRQTPSLHRERHDSNAIICSLSLCSDDNHLLADVSACWH